MTPGPHEPTANQLQNYLAPIVDDLIKLYDEGVVIKTPLFPDGKQTCNPFDVHIYNSLLLKVVVFVWYWWGSSATTLPYARCVDSLIRTTMPHHAPSAKFVVLISSQNAHFAEKVCNSFPCLFLLVTHYITGFPNRTAQEH
jgi:hypothetical protein